MVPTCSHARALGNLPVEVKGAARKAARRGEVQGPTKPKGAAHELWVGLLASMNCVRVLCNARTRGSRSWGRNAVWRSLGKSFELYAISHSNAAYDTSISSQRTCE